MKKTRIAFQGEIGAYSEQAALRYFGADIDLLKIESRPLHGKPFDYFFYLDFEGSIREEATQKALKHLEEITTFLQVLGSYKKGQMQ